jgi:hypothetical protein
VRQAVEALVREYRAVAIPFSGPGPAPKVWTRVAADPARAAVLLASTDAWRKDVASLVAMVTAGLPNNGFGPQTVTLAADEWRALHEELQSAFAPRK